ncbi:MAG: peptidoglycan DD-metalloendopeptidase family protein [Bacilli bacterium]|nr:peptidoglycan DD-metalloendopeptidase family protein [Bacilli bacterium]
MSEVISNNYDSEHQALDIVSSDHNETDIIALENGIVETVIKNKKTTDHNTKGNDTYGNYIKIKQTDGKEALYAHMKYGSINVNVGDFVEKGSIIGTMGSTGNAYGNHLHLEVKNENGIKENPLISLNKPIEEKKEETKEISKENAVTEPPKEETKKEEKTIIKNEYLNNTEYNDGSIVDALKEINIDSSYQYRKKLAIANGITNYHGSYDQNVKLLKLLKNGQLKKAY